MKKLIVLLGLGGLVYGMVNKRKKAAAAEAKLWDEATGTTPPAAPAS